MAGGFLSAEAARRAMRRVLLRERLRLLVSSGSALLDRLDHASQAERDCVLSLIERGIALAYRDGQGAVGRDPVDQVEGQDVREQELLEGANLMLELLDAMIIGVRHGLFSGQSRIEPTAADGAAHRLSQGEK